MSLLSFRMLFVVFVASVPKIACNTAHFLETNRSLRGGPQSADQARTCVCREYLAYGHCDFPHWSQMASQCNLFDTGLATSEIIDQVKRQDCSFAHCPDQTQKACVCRQFDANGDCDFPHWSQMVTTCNLGGDLTTSKVIDQVKAEDCSFAGCNSRRRRSSPTPTRRRRSSPSPPSLTVYNIESASAPRGFMNKNAGDVLGDINFIFAGTGGSGASARGCYRYYSAGVVQQAHVTVTRWGAYQHCNHDAHNKYTCDGTSPEAGKEQDSHTGGVWYSFPSAGKGVYWDQSGNTKVVNAGSFIYSLGNAARCDCSSSSVAKDSCQTCAKCVIASYKANPRYLENAWESAFADAEVGDVAALDVRNGSEIVV